MAPDHARWEKRSKSANPRASAREAALMNVFLIRAFCRVTLFLLDLSRAILMSARLKNQRPAPLFQRLIAAHQ
jgi:hypothetical protein